MASAIHEPAFQRSAKIGLAVLTLINLFNYLDRYVVSALVESLKASELKITDMQAGLLMTGFIVVYMCTSPFFGVLGDRMSRTKLLSFGVGLWSVATAMAGFTTHFATLFLCRATVGIGEAAYGTISPALISDYFSAKYRGRVYSIFYAAIPIGAALGYVVGGLVDHAYGWRATFFIAGIPGIFLAWTALKIMDPPRGIQETAAPTDLAPKGFRSYIELLKNRSYLWTVTGYAAYTFALGGLAFWMPAFLVRVRGLSKTEATVTFGTIVVATGFIGTFAGGWLADWILKFHRNSYLLVSGVATLLAVPFTYLALTSPVRNVYLPSIVVAELLLFVSTGPVNSAIAAAVPAGMRACAFAASNFLIHIFGDVPSPPLIGAISDASSLGHAVLVVPLFVLASGMIWTYAALNSVDASPARS